MKRLSITLFIFSTIAILALVSWLFPKEGLTITLRFPAMSDIFPERTDTLKIPSEAEIKEKERLERLERLRSELGEFEYRLACDSARFDLPGNDLNFFDSLFHYLDNSDKQAVRIIHYGDSQLEEDRISMHLRKFFQTHFGGCGQGMMPLNNYCTFQTVGRSSASLPKRMIFGSPEFRGGSDKYGPYGRFNSLYGSASFSFKPVAKNDSLFFNELSLVAGNVRSDLTVRCGEQTRTIEKGTLLDVVSFSLPDSSRSASFSVSGSADLYGALLDGSKGVNLDNVAMRGCAGTMFTSMNKEQIAQFFEKKNVKLVLLEYGANIVLAMNSPKSIADFTARLKRQIRHFQSASPGVTIIYMGPADMAKVRNGKLQTVPIMETFIDSVRCAVNECGAAYWDIYRVMGGHNSMIEWVKARPQLAGKDYIHFTLKGSERISREFNRSMLQYYEYYRKKEERVTEAEPPCDSIQELKK